MMANIGFRSARYIWADKAALFLACAFILLFACFWSFAFFAVGDPGARHLWSYMGVRGLELGLLGVEAIWLVMRGVDFLVGGSAYGLLAKGAGHVNSIAVKWWAHHHGAPAAAGYCPSDRA